MSLTTASLFVYGHSINDSNNYIDFSEDGGATELSASLDIGSYTLTDFVSVLLRAMNSAGSQEYRALLDRSTNKITLEADNNFDLLVSAGTHSAISAFELVGFTSNRTLGKSYEADTGSGYVYRPQYNLQGFIDFNDNVEASESSVTSSASGIVEVVSYGENRFMEANIIYATDIEGQGVITNNANGVSDLRKFLVYAIKKRPLEFAQDVQTPSSFTPCILEATPANKDGTGFQMYEMYAKGLANYFETKTLKFRKIKQREV